MRTAETLRRALGPASASDDELVRRYVASNDGEAFSALTRRHGPAVAATCVGVLGAGPDAEDAAQSVWLVFARRAAELRDPAAVAGWLRGTARRVAVRMRRRRGGPAGGADRTTPCTQQHVVSRETLAIIHEELGRLPEQERAALTLCGLEGLPRAETARRLGASLGTLKRNLETGRRRLGDRLRQRGVTASVAAVALAGAFTQSAVGRALGSIVLAAVLAGGVGLMFTAAGPPLPTPPKADAPAVPQDRFGDPLPRGAAARLGTVRLRHGTQFGGLAAIPGGKHFATTAGVVVTVWDAATGRAVRRWRADPADRNDFNQPAVAASADGRLLAAGGTDGVVRVWDTSGKLRRELRPDGVPPPNLPGRGITSAAVVELAFSDRQVAALTHAGEWLSWDAATGKALAGLRGRIARGEHSYRRALSADGSRLAVLFRGPAGSVLRVWDLARLGQLVNQRLPRSVTAAALSPRGRLVAVSPLDGPGGKTGVALIEARTGRRVRFIPTEFAAYKLCFLAGGDLILANNGRFDFNARGGRGGVWAVKTGKPVCDLNVGPTRAMCPLRVGDKPALAAVSRSGTVTVWDARTGRPLTRPDGHESGVAAVRFTARGAVTVSRGPTSVRVWDWRTGRPLRRVPTPAGGDLCGLSPGGRFAVLRSKGGLTVVPTAGGRTRRIGGVPAQPDTHYGFTPGGRLVCNAGGRLTVYDSAGAAPRTLTGDAGLVNGLAVSPDGRWVAAAVGDGGGPLRVWDFRTGRRLPFSSAATGDPRQSVGVAVAFSPDGRLVAASRAGGGPVTVWEVASRRVCYRLAMPASRAAAATRLAFSPGGWRIAAGYGQATYREAGIGGPSTTLLNWRPGVQACVWDIAAGREVRRFAGHDGGVADIAFTPDGRHVATAGRDTTVLIWKIDRRATPAVPRRPGPAGRR